MDACKISQLRMNPEILEFSTVDNVYFRSWDFLLEVFTGTCHNILSTNKTQKNYILMLQTLLLSLESCYHAILAIEYASA